jgi:predicted RNA binding protein YcfA (HicA-like mRNA interferase family)
MKVRDIVRQIEADGWRMLKRTGSGHRQFKHPTKPGRVTVSGDLGDDLSAGLRISILKQAGLR